MIATLRHRPSIQGVCSGFLESLDQLLRVEGVESMGDVIAALLSAQSHLQKNLAVFVHQAQQFDHVLCRIEGEVRLHHFQNPLKLALITCSSRLWLKKLIKSWPLIFSNSLPTNILFPVVVLHSYNHVLKRSMKHQNKNVIINPSSSLGWPVTLPFFPSAIFLCFPDSECWIKLALPPLEYFLSTSQYRHLNCSLSTYYAQSPTKSLLASFSPNHPVCQLIDFFPLWPDILPERQPLKSKFSFPMPESVTVEQR